jgi:predicted nucleic acid-binding protein
MAVSIRRAIRLGQHLRPSLYVFPSVRQPMSDNAVLAAMRRIGIAKEEMSRHGFRAMASTILDEGCNIYPVPADIAKCCGLLRGRFAARGRQRTQADLLIAATAQIEQLTMVARNVRHFEDCGIASLNPFSKTP